jgi:hypothetical protein
MSSKPTWVVIPYLKKIKQINKYLIEAVPKPSLETFPYKYLLNL